MLGGNWGNGKVGGGMGGGAAPRQGGGQMAPGGNTKSPGGGYSFQAPNQLGGQARLETARNALMRAQEQCARGDGSQCILAQQLQQRLSMLQNELMGQATLDSMRGKTGSMGTNGRGGRGRVDPNAYEQQMIQNMYGGGMGGGGMG